MVTRDGDESLQRPLLKRLTSPSSGVLPSRQGVECGTILAHLLHRCTRLLMVLPSRQQSAMCHIMSCGVLPSRQQYHIGDYPGTPPPSVYQVTHSTAFQAAECHVSHPVLWRTAFQAAECHVSHPVLWRTALQAEYRVFRLPGTPPPSVYQVTQSTALQAAECYMQPLVL